MQFVLKTAPSNLVNPRNASGGTIFDRPVSSSTQEFGTQKENHPLSQPVLKVEALAQTTGKFSIVVGFN